jgi:hypothetical protein
MAVQLVAGTVTLEPGTNSVFSALVPHYVQALGGPNPWLCFAETVDPIDAELFQVDRLGFPNDPRPSFTTGSPSAHESALGCGRVTFSYTLTGLDPVDVRFVFAFGTGVLDGSGVLYLYDPTIVVE